MKHFFLLFILAFSSLVSVSQDSLSLSVSEPVDVNPEVIESTSENYEFDESVFQNVSAKGKEGAAQVTWSLDYELLNHFQGGHLIVKYNTAIGEKRDKAGMEGNEWKYSEPIPINSVSYTIEDLIEAEKYVFKLGLAKEGDISNLDHDSKDIVWSEKGKFKTERSWGIIRFLVLMGALGLFIFGMKVMSEGLQQAAGSRLRKMLASMTTNRFTGVLSGFGITSVVQSSSVTTVMTVSFVNAGLMTLRESAGVMMGANIGTTITAWLVLLLGFKVSISSYALVIVALATPLIFMSSSRAKNWGNAIIGFSVLFLGLQFLKEAVPSLDQNSGLVQFFIEYKDIPVFGTLMFIALGALVTVVIQSSSAAMTLTMAMVAKGIIPFEVATAMILGENIGTTITAEIASLVGNVHAKRSARIHSMFNIVGVGWMILIFPFFLDFVALFVDGDPFSDPGAANTGLAIFHTAFNAANVLIMIWFVPLLVRLAIRTVKSRGDLDEEFHLEYIGSGILGTPELAIMEAKKEVAKFGNIVRRQLGFVEKLVTETNKKEVDRLLKKVKKYEAITDRMETEIATYITKLSEGQLSERSSLHVRSMLRIVNDLERVGDICYQMSISLERKNEKKLWFTPEQRENILGMFKKVEKAVQNMENNLNNDYEIASLPQAKEFESEINSFRDKLRKTHLRDTEKKEYNFQTGIIYNDLFSSLEKVGDHVINVTEAVVGQV